MIKQPSHQSGTFAYTLLALLTLACLMLGTVYASSSCTDPRDTYQHYDNRIRNDTINRIPSEFYVLSYTWAPDHCAKVKTRDKQPGGREYLQCGQGKQFGYVLHGLWPQGRRDKRGGYPRACLGDRPKIPRHVLNKYLCMTPSARLLQHEYENHGTCMHDPSLTSPEAYFDQAQTLHKQLVMPSKKLGGSPAAIKWFLKYNPQLKADMLYHDNRSAEWRFCYDNNFEPTRCFTKKSRSRPSRSKQRAPDNCLIKGNISKKSKLKKYYLPGHKYYKNMWITPRTGERCFTTEQEAIAAGWKKAR